MMNICSRYYQNRDDAASALNLAYFKVLTHLDKYKENVPFEAWIKRITINTVIDEHRKNKKLKESTDYYESNNHVFENLQVDFNEAALQLDADQLEAFIHRLPGLCKQIFNLFAIDGYSHAEIADLLNIKEGTSKWYVSDARQRLKKMIHNSLNKSMVKKLIK